jgi:hypothetical protein
MVHQALGDGVLARHCFEESLAIWREIGEQGSLAQTLNQFGQSLIAQTDWPRAQGCFLEALAVASKAQITPVMLEALLGVAALRAGTGDTDSALELVLHVLQEKMGTQDLHKRAEHLRAELEAQLPAQHIEVIRTRAQGKRLDALVQDLLNGL